MAFLVNTNEIDDSTFKLHDLSLNINKTVSDKIRLTLWIILIIQPLPNDRHSLRFSVHMKTMMERPDKHPIDLTGWVNLILVGRKTEDCAFVLYTYKDPYYTSDAFSFVKKEYPILISNIY